MSILNTELQPVLTEPQRRARHSKEHTLQLANYLIRQWHIGWDTIWSSNDPQAVLDELGAEAGELLALNEAMIVFFAHVLAGTRQGDLDAILAKVAAKPTTTTHSDGSVTIN